MLSREDNELLVRIGPGTAMGALMRQYWVPAFVSAEIAEPDCPPIRVKLLGERLVAFRDTSGRIGLIEEFCAHRGVSMFLGRNEHDGLRCVFHGWKYDFTGQCIDMPTEPEGSPYPEKIRLASYPTVERGGVVWAFMGAGEPPAPPNFEWTRLRPDQRIVTRTWQECNWLQALEGGIDSMHASTLHTVIKPDSTRSGLKGLWTKPVVLRDEVDLTSYGHVYASTRPLGNNRKWVKIYQYVMPFSTFFPFELGGEGQEFMPTINGHIFVPMDDENTMVYNWIGRYGPDPLTASERETVEWARGRAPGEIGADLRKSRNKDVDWLIDRRVQKTETYSGIDGINTQDHAVQESMGPIVDRTKEHLGSTDAAVMATRKLLLRWLKQGGEDPAPGVLPTYYNVRAIERILEDGANWREVLRELWDPPAENSTPMERASTSS